MEVEVEGESDTPFSCLNFEIEVRFEQDYVQVATRPSGVDAAMLIRGS